MSLVICLFINAFLGTAQFWLWSTSEFKNNTLGACFVWGVFMFLLTAVNLIKG